MNKPKTTNRLLFGNLLTKAVYRIATEERKTIGSVQDELGYAIGRTAAGSPIEYWRKGYVPAQSTEVERLAMALYQRGGLRNSTEVQTFLHYAGHPDVIGCSERILPDQFTDELPLDNQSPSISGASSSNDLPTRVTIVLEGSIVAFHEQKRERVIAGVAALLGLTPDQIRVYQIKEG
jgi:hypothetical protein